MYIMLIKTHVYQTTKAIIFTHHKMLPDLRSFFFLDYFDKYMRIIYTFQT